MNLDDWRSRINDLDNQILDLLTQRAEAALQIGDLKRRQDAPSYAPEREADIIRRLIEKYRGPLASDTVAAVWREILSGCRAVEAPLRSEEHTSELQSQSNLVCRLLLEENNQQVKICGLFVQAAIAQRLLRALPLALHHSDLRSTVRRNVGVYPMKPPPVRSRNWVPGRG